MSNRKRVVNSIHISARRTLPFVLLFLFAGGVFAQPLFIPQKLSVSVPCMLRSYVVGDCLSELSKQPDSLEAVLRCEFDAQQKQSGSLVLNTRVANHCSFGWDANGEGSTSCEFDLDSVHGLLRNVIASYGGSYYPIGMSIVRIQLDSIPFRVVGDTQLVAESFAAAARGIVKDAYFSGGENGYCSTVPRGHWQKGYVSGPQRTWDTADYRFTLLMDVRPLDAVRPLPGRVAETITVVTDVSDGSIVLRFATHEQERQCTIFDLTGKCVRSMSIPANVTQCRLPHTNFPAGTYFARLGEMATSFVIP